MDHPGFIKLIIDEPAEDVHRIVYSDWLEENAEPERAEFIRVECELAKLPQFCHGPPEWNALRRREQELFNFNNISKWFRCRAFLRNTLDPEEFKRLAAQSVSAQLIRRGFVAEVSLTLVDWCGVECGCLKVFQPGCERCHGAGRVNAHGPAIVQATPLELVMLVEWCGAECQRCDGDGKAHGSDRPFEWTGPGTYPGPCPVCYGLYNSAVCLAWAKSVPVNENKIA